MSCLFFREFRCLLYELREYSSWVLYGKLKCWEEGSTKKCNSKCIMKFSISQTVFHPPPPAHAIDVIVVTWMGDQAERRQWTLPFTPREPSPQAAQASLRFGCDWLGRRLVLVSAEEETAVERSGVIPEHTPLSLTQLISFSLLLATSLLNLLGDTG